MPQSATGIRVSAVLAILGSVGTLLFTVVMAAAAFFAPPPRDGPISPAVFKGAMLAMAVFFACLSGWGIATGIGIFRRKHWARISMLVFAGLLTLMSAPGLLIVPFMPATQQAGANDAALTIVKVVMAAIYVLFLAIGVWWLALFNGKGAKEHCAGAGPLEESGRPLSISVIAWAMLVGIVCLPVAAMVPFPAILFGFLITGWGKIAVLTIYAAAQIYLGTALLRLEEEGRVGAIGFFGFGALSGAVTSMRLDMAELMRRTQTAMPQFFPAGAPPAMTGPVWSWAIVGVLVCLLPIYFLVRRREAFRR